MSESEGSEGFFGGGRNFVERLSDAAAVESVYGDPVTVGEKTVIPVARVAFGFGGGAGSNEGMGDADEEFQGGEGWGGGGAVRASPVGVLEVTDSETRWIRYDEGRDHAKWLALGLLVGLFLGRRGKRRAAKRAMRKAEQQRA
ncbi:spore germination protein GerW family protein [Halomarina salina]|uniref:Spore germination protein GerW family protein n=1 Tax=Halomarina salina TaxID=1872699 RepID=A0ABD5RN40_9EURY|nr:spore germination protein GerW family protein [Halomarina salina]